MKTQMKAALIFKAGELYELGCNSSQAVCGALAGHYGLDQETAFRMASSFGDGTSRLRGTCGAADALVIMAGFEKDTSIPGDTGTREENYRMVRELVAEFKRRHGSVLCATLCGPAGKDRKRCRRLVESAVEIYADYLGWQ